MFDQALHDQCDNKARNAVKEIFKDSRVFIRDIASVYPGVGNSFMSADLGVIKGLSHICNLEVEISLQWTNHNGIQYSKDKNHVTFLETKVFNWQNPEYTFGKKTHWVLFNKNCDKHYFVHHDNIIKSIMMNKWEYKDTLNRGLRKFLLIPKEYIRLNALYNLKDQLDS